MTHLAGISAGEPYELATADLRKNTLYLGASGVGKTNVVTGALLSDIEGDTPWMVLDRGGKLTANLWATVAACITSCKQRGDTTRAEHLRRQYRRLIFKKQNYSGISFDITKLRTVVDDDGSERPETCAERASYIMSPLLKQRGQEALQFNVIAETGPHAFVLIVAAHLKAHHVVKFLHPYAHHFRAYVSSRIRLFGHGTEPEVQDALEYFQQLTTAHEWRDACDSTRRNFKFFQTCKRFFHEDRLDYHAFHDAGGRLLVTLEDPDDIPNILMFRMLETMWVNAAVRRPVTPGMKPSLLIIDEVEYVDPAALLAHMENQRNKKAFVWIAMQSLDQFEKHQGRLLSVVQRITLFRPTQAKDAQEFAGRVIEAGMETVFRTKVSWTRGMNTGQTRTRGQSVAHSESETESWKGDGGGSAKIVRTSVSDGDSKVALIETTPVDGALDLSGGSETHGLTRTANWSESVTTTLVDTYTVTQERISVDEQVAHSRELLRRMPKYQYWDLYDDGRAAYVRAFPHREDSENTYRYSLGVDLIREQHAEYYAGTSYPVIVPAEGEPWLPEFPMKDARPLALKPKKEKAQPTADQKPAKATKPQQKPPTPTAPPSWED
jgi:hypothetical protein